MLFDGRRGCGGDRDSSGAVLARFSDIEMKQRVYNPFNR